MTTITESVLDRLLRSPAGIAAAAEQRQERLATRRQTAAARSKTIATAERSAPARAAKRAAADAAVQERLDALEAAKVARADVYRLTRAETASSDREVARFERELRHTCSPLVETFREELIAERDRLRTGRAGHGAEVVGETDSHFGKVVRLSTAPSRTARLAAVLAASQEDQLDVLRFEVDDAVVAERIATFWQGLPAESFEAIAGRAS